MMDRERLAALIKRLANLCGMAAIGLAIYGFATRDEITAQALGPALGAALAAVIFMLGSMLMIVSNLVAGYASTDENVNVLSVRAGSNRFGAFVATTGLSSLFWWSVVELARTIGFGVPNDWGFMFVADQIMSGALFDVMEVYGLHFSSTTFDSTNMLQATLVFLMRLTGSFVVIGYVMLPVANQRTALSSR